jgi:signal transduction histidine kinase/ActR/RegA family two-component response regulator
LAEGGPAGSACRACAREGYESLALIPLRSGERDIIGLLQLHDRQPDRFTPKTISFLEGLGSSIGIALSRKASAERIHHLNRVLRAIRRLNKLTASEKDPDRLIHKAGELLVEHRGYESTLILLTDEAGAPRTYAKAGLSQAFQAAPEILRLGSLPPCCVRAGLKDGIYHVTDPAEECASCPMAADRPQGDTLCARLKHGATTYGYIMVFMDRLLAADAENQSIFAEMAADLVSALHSIEQDKAVQRAAQERERIEAELRQAQKMEAVGRLAGGIAHDFNNMLGVIIGYSEVALEGLPPVDPLHDQIQEIKKAAQRSADLTRQLLAFSRKQVVAPKVIDLNKTIADREKMLARLIGEDIEVKYLPGADLWSVFLDPSQIDQILANLAVNARDAIADTGTITIETNNIFLDEAYCGKYAQASPGEYVVLSFSDTGMGMDAETIEHIFEPFFTTKKEGTGTGLGLSTVFGIVRQYEGFIHTYSEPGLGTTFKIYFPRHLGEAEATLQKEQEASLEGTETVLIVEDEEQLLDLARTVLTRSGYNVLVARTPREACRLAENYEGDIHLLLTDVVMPEMNGKELQAQIGALRPGIKTLFMSGYTANVITHRGVIDRGVEFINKPFTVNSLTQKIREVLES